MYRFKSGNLFLCFLILCFALFFVLMPDTAEAKWHSNSDQLPGLTDSEMLTYALILAGGIVLYYYINKSLKAKRNTTKETKKVTPSDSLRQSNRLQEKLNLHLSSTNKRNLRILPLIQLRTNPPLESDLNKHSSLFENKAVMLGFAVKF